MIGMNVNTVALDLWRYLKYLGEKKQHSLKNNHLIEYMPMNESGDDALNVTHIAQIVAAVVGMDNMASDARNPIWLHPPNQPQQVAYNKCALLDPYMSCY